MVSISVIIFIAVFSHETTQLTTTEPPIPEHFDAREKWPHCESIGQIRNEVYCGAGWAFAAVQTMTDRLCIQTNGTIKFQFSPQDLLTCCQYCDQCNSGNATKAWQYWIDNGLVSGGDYYVNLQEGCKPYTYATSHTLQTRSCVQRCQTAYNTTSYEKDKYYGKNFYKIAGNVEDIQREILTNGPVQSMLYTFEDYFFYKDGVYYHKEQYGFMGFTHVKILGWGTENGTDYWLTANSLGTDWAGLNGFFKIRRGTNEAGIEEDLIAGWAMLGGNEGDNQGGNSSGTLVFSWSVFAIHVIFVFMRM